MDEYKALQNQAFTVYGVSIADDTPSPLKNSVFGDIAEEIEKVGFPFSFFHVEPLLDQAQELLNRSLQDRKIFSEACAQAYQVSLELEEFARLDEVHSQEISNGIYTYERDRAAAELSGELNNLQSLNEALNAVDINHPDVIEEVALRSLITYANASSEFKPPKGAEFAAFNLSTAKQNFSGDKAAVTSAIEKILAEYESIRQSAQTSSQIANARAAAKSSEFKAASTKINHDFLDSSVHTKEWRLEVTRLINKKKMASVTVPDGPLNYAGLAYNARRRYVGNLAKAYQRLFSAAEGIKKIYAYDQKLPDYKEFSSVGADINDSFLDECWLWAQDALNYLALQQRREQNAVFQFLLSDLVAGPFSQVIDFDMKKESFEGCKMTRLRGVGLSYIGQPAAKSVKAWLQPPTSGTYVKEDLSTFSIEAPAAKSYFGRVSEWTTSREPDVFGVVLTHNRSPIGTWKIGIPVDQGIKDFLIDMHVSAY